MSDIAATRRQLKIKTGVVKRYQKELKMYREEVTDNQKKLESAIAAAGGDEEPWEVRNAKSLVRESENMVRDTAARLERAAGELGDLVESAKGVPESDAELLDAETALAAAGTGAA